jgi:NAD(P)-dependent dehydrogenase (short-subunit alcohol dehydrogenase family)
MNLDPLFDFTGKVALVTGGSRGLGYQMVKAFAERGADVIIASRKLENCEQVASEVRSLGRRALAFAAHVGKWADCDALIAAAYAQFGRVDILINNAGMSPACPSHAMPESLFDSVLNLNFKGPFRLASQIGHRMSQGDGGTIINISSTGALMALPSGHSLRIGESGAQCDDRVTQPRIRPEGTGQHDLTRAVPDRYRQRVGAVSARDICRLPSGAPASHPRS